MSTQRTLESQLSILTDPARRFIGRRTGATALLELPPTDLRHQLVSFDEVIKVYNQLTPEDLQHDLRFVPKVKLDHPELPTSESLLMSGSTQQCIAFRRALRTMSPLMQRAELGEPEPNLGFAIWDPTKTTPRERLLGGIVQAYGLTLVHDSRQNQPVHPEDYAGFYGSKDDILDALLEVSALEHAANADSPLYELAMNLGWFEARSESGEHLFSEDIRNLAAI